MRIFSWNVNGIRAVSRKGLFKPFIEKYRPDIICLQETKAEEHQVSLEIEGYREFWNPAQKKGYSGTAIFSMINPVSIFMGLSDDHAADFKLNGDAYGDPNKEGRVITAEYPDFFLVNVYTPNAKNDLSRLKLRHLQWDPAFLTHCLRLEKNKPVIICGDMNVAHTANDLARPKENEGNKGFTREEREGIDNMLKAGYIDAFRMFHEGNGFYTWWPNWANARERNLGWRIDYFMVSSALKGKIISSEIHADISGSDHCPVSLALSVSA